MEALGIAFNDVLERTKYMSICPDWFDLSLNVLWYAVSTFGHVFVFTSVKHKRRQSGDLDNNAQ